MPPHDALALKAAVRLAHSDRHPVLSVHQNRVDPVGRCWRVLNGGVTLMTLGLAGARFSDGILIPAPPREEERAA